MIEIRNILFLTDFSAEAAHALHYARDLAERYGSRVYLLHVVEDPTRTLDVMSGGLQFDLLRQDTVRAAEEKLAQIHQEEFRGSPLCEQIVEVEELFRGVLKVVYEKHINVIVLSAHTHQGFHLHLLSNLPEKLVHKAPCHVFVIHSSN
jgi:nucleotide-binding universal stress UspA family protein